jgi:predicted AAA+ superfamily ATPase
MIRREFNVSKTNSLFLFGPRQVGKTTHIREEVRALPTSISHILVDEAQRVPDLLNEIQSLIDDGIQKKFFVTGSSPRKLKRGQANLLGGGMELQSAPANVQGNGW